MPLYVNVQGRQPQRKSLETLLILHSLEPNRAGSFMGRQDNGQFKGALADRPINLGKRMNAGVTSPICTNILHRVAPV